MHAICFKMQLEVRSQKSPLHAASETSDILRAITGELGENSHRIHDERILKSETATKPDVESPWGQVVRFATIDMLTLQPKVSRVNLGTRSELP